MTECQYFVAVKIWDRQACVTNQCRDIFMLTNQSWANKWKFHKNNQTALIVLLATWMVRKVAQAVVNFWVYVTCLLRVLVIQFAALLCVADAQVSQEVNKERTIEILAELVENKPGNKMREALRIF